MISLVDTYLQKIQANMAQPEINTSRQDRLRTHIRAFRPSGHIIQTHPFSLRDAFDSDKRSVRYFKDGINGYGNDYSIGKINDLTIKLGSLGIAGLIATSKSSPLQKAMEFLGLGCWLGAMSLWPKLAIKAPVKALKGVDLNSEYKTYAGHRKSFYQDPQFICWDMISDDEINKMADKLNIPKNIKNRRKATENKARQIAVQGNTLAMLTAGVATPLIASIGADKLGKHVLTPLLQKYQEMKAENIEKTFSQQVLENLSDYKLDASADALIEKHVKPNMTPEDRDAIIRFFKRTSKDFALDEITNSTLLDIFKKNNVTSFNVPITNDLKKQLVATIVLDVPKPEYMPQKLVDDMLAKYSNTINKGNLSDFISTLEAELNSKYDKNIQLKGRKPIINRVKKLLLDNSVITVVSPEETKEKLKQMALMSQVYNKHYVGEFRNKFVKYTFGNELSLHAHIWRELPKKILKIFNLSSSEMKEFLTCASNTNDANKILYAACERIFSDPVKYEKAMKELGIFANKMSAINDKFLPKTLDYIDGMTDMFANSPYKDDLRAYAAEIETVLRSKRVDILTKYIGTDVTLYSPIRTLAVLKTSQEKLKEIAKHSAIDTSKLFDAIKNVMFNLQTTDAFINKLNNLKELLKSEEDFKIVLNMVFDKLPNEVEKLMPKDLAARINDNTTLLKGLLLNLSDDVNFKFGPANEEKLLKAAKNLDVYKYINDLFFTSFKDKESIIDNIMKTVKLNPEKIDMLQRIFKLSKEDLEKVIRGNDTPIRNNTYFESARYKARDMIMLFGTDNLEQLGEISIGKTKMCQTSSAMGKTLLSLMQDAGNEMVNYKRWFKRVGIAFIAVVGVSAYAISQFGKKNEFNQDKYIERSKA